MSVVGLVKKEVQQNLAKTEYEICETKEIQRPIEEKTGGVSGSEDEPFAAGDGEGFNKGEENSMLLQKNHG